MHFCFFCSRIFIYRHTQLRASEQRLKGNKIQLDCTTLTNKERRMKIRDGGGGSGPHHSHGTMRRPFFFFFFFHWFLRSAHLSTADPRFPPRRTSNRVNLPPLRRRDISPHKRLFLIGKRGSSSQQNAILSGCTYNHLALCKIAGRGTGGN